MLGRLFMLNVQPGLSGAHFFVAGKAWQKIAGTEDGKAAQIILKKQRHQKVNNFYPDERYQNASQTVNQKVSS